MIRRGGFKARIRKRFVAHLDSVLLSPGSTTPCFSCLLPLSLQKRYVNGPNMNRGNGLENQLETSGLDIRKNLLTIKIMEFVALLLKEGGFITI